MFRNVVSGLVRQRVAFNGVQRRNFAGGHAKTNWTGIDKTVRDVFPEDHQLSMAILGGYFGIYVLVKITSALTSSKKVEA